MKSCIYVALEVTVWRGSTSETRVSERIRVDLNDAAEPDQVEAAINATRAKVVARYQQAVRS